MVAGHPPHLPEALFGPRKGRVAVLGALAHVAAEDEGVVGVREELFEGFAVGFEGEMYVTYRVQFSFDFGCGIGKGWGRRVVVLLGGGGRGSREEGVHGDDCVLEVIEESSWWSR